MYNELDIRARDIRFYDSLIFQADLYEDEENREYFIRKIALHNIHLSSLCIVSNCYRNENLEKDIVSLSCTHARTDNQYKKPKGFLALLELERYDKIASIIAKTEKHNKILHNSIIQVIVELKNSELIVSFLRLLVENSRLNTTDLILDFIKATKKIEIEFSIDQKKQLENLYYLIKGKLGFGKNRIANMVCLKFLLTFRLSKKMIPRNINQFALQMLENLEYIFIKQFYDHFEIHFPFSYYQLCEIFIESSKKSLPKFFLNCFFEVTDVVQQNTLIVKSLRKGRHFAGFVFSLITDENAKLNVIGKYPGHPITKYLRNDLDISKCAILDQYSLLQLIHTTLDNGIRNTK